MVTYGAICTGHPWALSPGSFTDPAVAANWHRYVMFTPWRGKCREAAAMAIDRPAGSVKNVVAPQLVRSTYTCMPKVFYNAAVLFVRTSNLGCGL